MSGDSDVTDPEMASGHGPCKTRQGPNLRQTGSMSPVDPVVSALWVVKRPRDVMLGKRAVFCSRENIVLGGPHST